MFKFLILILGWGTSFLIFRFRFAIIEFTGHIPFAEKYFRGTKNFLVLLGVGIFILTLMYFTGTLSGVFVAVFAPLF